VHFILYILWYNIHRIFGGRTMEEKEEKTFNKKFVWSLIGGLAAIALVVYLVAINANGGSVGLGDSLDGTYYVYHKYYNVVIEDNILKIDGEKALFKGAYAAKHGDEDSGDIWRVDTEKKVIIVQQTNLHEFPYVLKDDILTFDNDDYVKKNSETYKKAKKMSELAYDTQY